jgi:DNA-binding HxlR family transcriptional regulator
MCPRTAAPSAEVLARVGGKWTVLVVTLLGDGSQHFNELRRGLGSISQRMLTSTQRGLERDGLVTRRPSSFPSRCNTICWCDAICFILASPAERPATVVEVS